MPSQPIPWPWRLKERISKRYSDCLAGSTNGPGTPPASRLVSASAWQECISTKPILPTGGFVTLTNTGNHPDRLIGATPELSTPLRTPAREP